MSPGVAIRLVFTGATMWVMAGHMSAQTPPDVIQQNLKLGQQVSVIDDQGGRFRGRVTDVSGDSFSIAKGRNQTIVPYRSVLRVDLDDDLSKGMKIGALVGAGLFAVEAYYASQDGITLNGAGYAVFAALYAGGGAAIGAGIDALIGGDRTLYQRSGTNRVSVAPVLGRSRVGAVVGIAW